MQFPQSTLKKKSMIPASINSQTYFFTISHITKEADDKLIYGIRLNNGNYFLNKDTGITNCVQLDTNLPLNKNVLKEMCAIITEIELKYKKRPSLERINKEIFSILIQHRHPGKNLK